MRLPCDILAGMIRPPRCEHVPMCHSTLPIIASTMPSLYCSAKRGVMRERRAGTRNAMQPPSGDVIPYATTMHGSASTHLLLRV